MRSGPRAPGARRHAVIVGLLVLTAAIGSLSTSPASAATVADSGIWWSAGPAPLPPNVPDGGLWVQQAATGQTAISAFRLATTSGEMPQSVALTIRSNGAPIGSSIKACLTVQFDWKPARGGALADAPKPDCATFASVGQLAAGKLVFDLAGLPQRDVYSFAVVTGNVPIPALDPLLPAKPTVTYDVTFEKPAAPDVASAPAPAPAPVPVAAADADEVPPPDRFFESQPSFVAPEEVPLEVATFETVTRSLFEPIETFASPAVPTEGAPASIRPTTQVFTPAVQASTSRDIGRIAAAAALVGLFAFGNLRAGNSTSASTGSVRASGGRVSIYDWPPAPAALSSPLRAFQQGSAPKAIVSGEVENEAAAERVGKAPALR